MNAIAGPDLIALRQRHGAKQGVALLAAMVAEFPDRVAIISSFGIESALLLAQAAEVDRALPVIFLDSGELFDETHRYRTLLASKLGLTNIRIVGPDPAAEANATELWRSDPDRCCQLRKVIPLGKALQGFSALVDGRKRFHGADRSELQTLEAGDNGLIKVSPLARFTQADFAAAFAATGLPEHPLAQFGYRSVGCWPCSRPAQPGEGPRAGRWAGSAKTECGIHQRAAEKLFV